MFTSEEDHSRWYELAQREVTSLREQLMLLEVERKNPELRETAQMLNLKRGCRR